jgi:hypothetical protein
VRLQVYLDEFAFRFNRRRTPMAAFQTLLGLASGAHGPTTYEMLYASESARQAQCFLWANGAVLVADGAQDKS